MTFLSFSIFASLILLAPKILSAPEKKIVCLLFCAEINKHRTKDTKAKSKFKEYREFLLRNYKLQEKNLNQYPPKIAHNSTWDSLDNLEFEWLQHLDYLENWSDFKENSDFTKFYSVFLDSGDSIDHFLNRIKKDTEETIQLYSQVNIVRTKEFLANAAFNIGANGILVAAYQYFTQNNLTPPAFDYPEVYLGMAISTGIWATLETSERFLVNRNKTVEYPDLDPIIKGERNFMESFNLFAEKVAKKESKFIHAALSVDFFIDQMFKIRGTSNVNQVRDFLKPETKDMGPFGRVVDRLNRSVKRFLKSYDDKKFRIYLNLFYYVDKNDKERKLEMIYHIGEASNNLDTIKGRSQQFVPAH